MGIAKGDAVEAVQRLTDEYRRSLGQRLAIIFLEGDVLEQEKFAATSAVEAGALRVHAHDLYRKMATDIEPTIGVQRQFGGTQSGHLIRSMETLAKAAGVESLLPVPRLLEVATCKDEAAVADVCRQLIRSQVGDGLNCKHLERVIADAAISAGSSTNSVPVVIVGAQEEIEALEQGIPAVTRIRAIVREQVDGKQVLEVFNALKQQLKGNKSKKSAQQEKPKLDTNLNPNPNPNLDQTQE